MKVIFLFGPRYVKSFPRFEVVRHKTTFFNELIVVHSESRHTLRSIVKLFQTLYDVDALISKPDRLGLGLTLTDFHCVAVKIMQSHYNQN